ncbi:Nulp1-pending protein-like protein, partial [Bimuria novae-zelandiae CBS 107.79]
MSSRALRRAQRELEEKKQLEILEQEKAQNEEESEEEDEPILVKAQAKPSLFSMLGDAGDDDEEEDGEIEEEEKASEPAAKTEIQVTPAPKTSKKGKMKKKKGKGKSNTPAPEKTPTSAKAVPGLDEIDQALLALNLSSSAKSNGEDEPSSAASEEMQQLFSVLAVDTQHLHAANEMRKLFGRAAVQGNHDEDQPARNRRQQGGIAAAFAGRNQPGGRNLASLGLRRNIFVQGKEEWPRATLGGLGMEMVEKRSDGTVEYRFVHNTTYQSVQREFETCVGSMDPERMIQLMHFNPYHISTLLQVSEIAKQQRDNATSGELLERALFAFGRAVHSTFAHNLSQGKARLDFRRPENREFFLAVQRYIATLGIRATWRTAFEWAKLLISLAPEDDPYCMRLLIDQLALRGREPQALVDLVETDHLERAWKIPPNLAFSVALAHARLKNPQKARSALRSAIKEYPWIASRICKELEIAPIPKPVWGKEPNGDTQELLTQLYVPQAKDLWNTTEATSLLVEVCYSIDEPLGAGENPYWLAPINSLDLARHVILSDSPPLLSLLDPAMKARYTSTSDPLPPEDSIPSYSTSSSTTSPMAALGRTDALAELESLRLYFQELDLQNLVEGGGMGLEVLGPALERAGSGLQEFRRNVERVQAVQQRLSELGVEVV